MHCCLGSHALHCTASCSGAFWVLQELICFLGDGRLQPEVMEQHLCQPQVDQSIVCFLRAVTALELVSNETRYMTYVPGIDAYRQACALLMH